MIKFKLSILTVLTLIITSSFLISCLSDDNLIEHKIQQLKFEKKIDGKIKKNGQSKESVNYSVYTIRKNLNNQLIVDEKSLIISEGINKETGIKSFIITERKKIALRHLQPSAKVNLEKKEAPIERGYWYDGDDCFIYGTIYTGDDGTQLFVPTDAATQYLLNSCGWINVA